MGLWLRFGFGFEIGLGFGFEFEVREKIIFKNILYIKI